MNNSLICKEIEIPHYLVDGRLTGKIWTDNKTQVAALIRQANAHFRLSAKAWERRNQSGLSADTYKRLEKQEQDEATTGAEMLKPLGIECDWPGLYPSFTVNGFSEYETRSAVLSALNRPRNWIMPEEV